jgi:anti-anti-sigma factor
VGGRGPVHGGTGLEVSLLDGRPGIRAHGEITAITRAAWERALARLARQHADVSYVELSQVGFVDVAGVTALARTALHLSDGRVVVEHPPSQVTRVLDLFWPDLRRIEVVPR